MGVSTTAVIEINQEDALVTFLVAGIIDNNSFIVTGAFTSGNNWICFANTRI